MPRTEAAKHATPTTAANFVVNAPGASRRPPTAKARRSAWIASGPRLVHAREIKDETPWLHRLDSKQKAVGEARIFWNLLRREGYQLGLYRGPVDDHPHLQVWPDAGVDMATRLAALMTSVGRMKWAGARGRYQCDLGLGGQLVEVGSAVQVWNRRATITVGSLTKARSPVVAPAAAHATGHAGASTRQMPPVHVTPATAQEVTAMQSSLRADFEAADVNWQSWK